MAIVDKLLELLPKEARELLQDDRQRLTEIRLRSGKPVQLCFGGDGDRLTRAVLETADLRRLLAALMEYSIYARQGELDQGYFTLEDGSRVGVCGRMYREGSLLRMGDIGSACVRIARQLPGCADPILEAVRGSWGLRSTLLVSPPGMGKTTILRDVARQLSIHGYCVGIADERRELAACHMGVPTLEVGPRTDVMDGCPRSEAISRMVRAMSPEVVVADEIGGTEDALALADAARCGVALIASGHGAGFEDAMARKSLRMALEGGAFQRLVVLGPRPGAVRELWRREGGEGEAAWRCA